MAIVGANILNPCSPITAHETFATNPNGRTRRLIDELHRIRIEPKWIVKTFNLHC
jgi:hypothetical protein